MTDINTMPSGPEMDRISCAHCGNVKIKKRISRPYCSKKCYIDSRWISRECVTCGKSFMARSCYVRRGQMNNCSAKCNSASQRIRDGVEYHGRWYAIDKNGYMTCGDKKLHREIWAEANGHIPVGHDIHHIDGNKLNNILSNLEAIDHGEHSRHHVETKPRLPIRSPPKPCSSHNCRRISKARGLCTKHYQALMATNRRAALKAVGHD